MAVDEAPGYRRLFVSGLEWEDLILLLAPVARTVVEDERLWMYTKGLAGRMRHFTQNDQRAKELLEFIHDRRSNSNILNIMLTVLQTQPDLNGSVRDNLAALGGYYVRSLQAAQYSSIRFPETPSQLL